MYRSLMALNTHRLRLAVDSCIDNYFAVFHGVLAPETAGVFSRFSEGLDFGPSNSLVVPQSFEHFGYYEGDWPEEIGWLVEQTEAIVTARARARARHGLMRWRVNDVAIQRYSNPEDGIGWHRDFARDHHLVAIYSVIGECDLGIRNRDGVHLEYRVLPRALTLLSGPDPISGHDPRLQHRVGPPLTDEPRISIALRMNAVPRCADY
ncbi:hypothetical protein KBC99_01310 [Candidatus Saccharibacteria bacterium]|nr:hypothetical protein [Candidatus Saccharibacteria bacterium]